MNMLLTILLLLTQAVCLGLIAMTIFGFSSRKRDNSRQLVRYRGPIEN